MITKYPHFPFLPPRWPYFRLYPSPHTCPSPFLQQATFLSDQQAFSLPSPAPLFPHVLLCLSKSPSFLSFKLAQSSWGQVAAPSMSIMWLHLDCNYLCNKKEIYLLEREEGEARTSLSGQFPCGSGKLAGSSGAATSQGTQTLGRVSLWKENKMQKAWNVTLLCANDVPVSSPKLLNITKSQMWVDVYVWLCACVHTHMEKDKSVCHDSVL